MTDLLTVGMPLCSERCGTEETEGCLQAVVCPQWTHDEECLHPGGVG